jgi:hypothetical protein
MIREQCDELLANHTGRAKDAYWNSRHVCTALLQKKSRHGKDRVGKFQLELRIRLSVEHNSSNTGDPLSTGPLSSVGGEHDS